MKEINYWQQFLSTGKVEDYLYYRAEEARKERDEGSLLVTGSASFTSPFAEDTDGRNRKGKEKDAGLRGSDGNRAQGGFHRGI